MPGTLSHHAVPPFDEDELDAILIGLSLLRRNANPDDEDDAAERALGKIAALLPPPERRNDVPASDLVAAAIRSETKLRLGYVDKKGTASSRTVWPLEVAYFASGDGMLAWCETREDFRNFRSDRITTIEPTDEPLPVRRRLLLARWRSFDEGMWS